jgi:hypothetical protein
MKKLKTLRHMELSLFGISQYLWRENCDKTCGIDLLDYLEVLQELYIETLAVLGLRQKITSKAAGYLI